MEFPQFFKSIHSITQTYYTCFFNQPLDKIDRMVYNNIRPYGLVNVYPGKEKAPPRGRAGGSPSWWRDRLDHFTYNSTDKAEAENGSDDGYVLVTLQANGKETAYREHSLSEKL